MATTVYPPYTEAAAFTRAQWKELERQAMIYKYMVASVPVPPHLLSSDFTTATTTCNNNFPPYLPLFLGNFVSLLIVCIILVLYACVDSGASWLFFHF